MNDIFIDNSHRTRYQNMLNLAHVHRYDIERKSLFYILSGNKDLYQKKHAIYDFHKNAIMFEWLECGKVDLCSSSKALIRLGFNLYNGYYDNITNPLSLLCEMDSENLFIAYQAILLRFQDTQHYLTLARCGDQDNDG